MHVGVSCFSDVAINVRSGQCNLFDSRVRFWCMSSVAENGVCVRMIISNWMIQGVFTSYIMSLIAVSYRRCERNLRAKLDTEINSLGISANHYIVSSDVD